MLWSLITILKLYNLDSFSTNQRKCDPWADRSMQNLTLVDQRGVDVSRVWLDGLTRGALSSSAEAEQATQDVATCTVLLLYCTVLYRCSVDDLASTVLCWINLCIINLCDINLCIINLCIIKYFILRSGDNDDESATCCPRHPLDLPWEKYINTYL